MANPSYRVLEFDVTKAFGPPSFVYDSKEPTGLYPFPLLFLVGRDVRLSVDDFCSATPCSGCLKLAERVVFAAGKLLYV